MRMRKLAIASLLVAGVALSGSVFAQDGAAAPQAGTTQSATQHHAKHSKNKSHKSAKGSKSSKKNALPATTATP